MAADLREAVVGRRIKSASIFASAMIKYPARQKFLNEIKKARILDVSRRAKYLRFHLAGEGELVVHPKMTGHFLLVNKKIKNLKNKEKEPESLKYTRVKFDLDDGSELCFSDVRKFGTVRLFSKKEAENFWEKESLGPEPLEPSFEVDKFISLISSKSKKIKEVLMNPQTIAGIGNIYSDEMLYVAEIHPERLAKSLKTEELAQLYGAMCQVLRNGIALRGSSINNYRALRGDRGRYQEVRLVYGRWGEKCAKCFSKIERIKVGGRSACFCPSCQPE